MEEILFLHPPTTEDASPDGRRRPEDIVSSKHTRPSPSPRHAARPCAGQTDARLWSALPATKAATKPATKPAGPDGRRRTADGRAKAKAKAKAKATLPCHLRVRRLSMSGWGKPFPHIRDGEREPGREGLGDGALGPVA